MKKKLCIALLAVCILLIVTGCGGGGASQATNNSVVSTVTITPASSQSVLVGEKLNFTATAADQYGKSLSDIAFNWAVSPSDIGTISNGTFTALKEGTCVVTVTTASGKTASSGTITVGIPVLGSVSYLKADKNGEASVKLEVSDKGEEYALGIYSPIEDSLDTNGYAKVANLTFNGGGNSVQIVQSTLGVAKSLQSKSLNNVAFDEFLRRKAQEFLAEKPPVPHQRYLGIQSQLPNIGDHRQFYTFVPDKNGDGIEDRAAIDTVVKYIGSKCIIYLDSTNASSIPTYFTDSIIKNFAETFDNVIYDKMVTTFGERNDINQDGKVTILFSPTVAQIDAAGYFFSMDFAAKTYYQYSNEEDMFYIDTPNSSNELSYYEGALAHEFQHMINFCQHNNAGATALEDTWLDEGLAMYAMVAIGMPYFGHMWNYSSASSQWSLTGWEQQSQNYGVSELFVRYLVERYGLSILPKIVQTDKTGFGNIILHTGLNNIDDIFAPWVAALYLDNNGTLNSDSTFNYADLNLRGINQLDKNKFSFSGPQVLIRASLEGFTTDLRYGGIRYIQFSNLPSNKISEVTIKGPGDMKLGIVKIRIN